MARNSNLIICCVAFVLLLISSFLVQSKLIQEWDQVTMSTVGIDPKSLMIHSQDSNITSYLLKHIDGLAHCQKDRPGSPMGCGPHDAYLAPNIICKFDGNQIAKFPGTGFKPAGGSMEGYYSLEMGAKPMDRLLFLHLASPTFFPAGTECNVVYPQVHTGSNSGSVVYQIEAHNYAQCNGYCLAGRMPFETYVKPHQVNGKTYFQWIIEMPTPDPGFSVHVLLDGQDKPLTEVNKESCPYCGDKYFQKQELNGRLRFVSHILSQDRIQSECLYSPGTGATKLNGKFKVVVFDSQGDIWSWYWIDIEVKYSEITGDTVKVAVGKNPYTPEVGEEEVQSTITIYKDDSFSEENKDLAVYEGDYVPIKQTITDPEVQNDVKSTKVVSVILRNHRFEKIADKTSEIIPFNSPYPWEQRYLLNVDDCGYAQCILESRESIDYHDGTKKKVVVRALVNKQLPALPSVGKRDSNATPASAKASLSISVQKREVSWGIIGKQLTTLYVVVIVFLQLWALL